MADIITSALVRLDARLGADKHEVIRALADVVQDAGRAQDVDQLVADALAREETSATGLPGGIAIPHCRTTGVDEPTLAFARLRSPCTALPNRLQGQAEASQLSRRPSHRLRRNTMVSRPRGHALLP